MGFLAQHISLKQTHVMLGLGQAGIWILLEEQVICY